MGRTHEQLKKEKEKKPRVCIFDYSEREREKVGPEKNERMIFIFLLSFALWRRRRKKLMNKLNTLQLLLLIRRLK
jgi:hypothetical protein